MKSGNLKITSAGNFENFPSYFASIRRRFSSHVHIDIVCMSIRCMLRKHVDIWYWMNRFHIYIQIMHIIIYTYIIRLVIFYNYTHTCIVSDCGWPLPSKAGGTRWPAEAAEKRLGDQGLVVGPDGWGYMVCTRYLYITCTWNIFYTYHIIYIIWKNTI